MATPMLRQALELNTLIWRIGPYIRFPFQWNPQKYTFETEENPKRQLIWLFISTVYFGFLFALLLFLVTIGLKAPHIDKLQNWILTFELLPLVTYIFLYNWKIYSIGPANFIAYQNSLTEMLMQNSGTFLIKEVASTGGRTKLLQFAARIITGNDDT